MGVTISGMTGAGSIRHNNRSFSAANVDRSRTEQNIVFCNEDLKQVYHMVFDEALAAYNAKKTKTRDKIPDYYEHIRQSKQEKLFHEAIFQIGNMSDCGCGTPDGERAAAALKDFAESFAERNPHLRVFNMVLHMDEATPHLHVDFIPVATEQSRGLSTRVSMKQALKQQGFVGVGRKQTEWAAWMEREKEAVPFPVSWTVKMKKKQKETQDILSYHTQAAGCSDKARAKASGGRQPIEECGRTGL